MSATDGAHWSAEDYAWNPLTMEGVPTASLHRSAAVAPTGTASAAAADGAAEASPAAAADAAADARQAAAAKSRQRERFTCLVPGCDTALNDGVSAYSIRCRLCVPHMRADSVRLADGDTVRFCQKCNRLQPLEMFEGRKHTCTARLLEHNKRRRERNASRQGGADAPADGAAERDAEGGSGALDGPPLRAKRAAAAAAAVLIARVASGDDAETARMAEEEAAGADAAAERPDPRRPRRPARTLLSMPFSPPQDDADAQERAALAAALQAGDFDLGDWLMAMPVAPPPPPLLPGGPALGGGASSSRPWLAGGAASMGTTPFYEGGSAVRAAAAAAGALPLVMHVKLPGCDSPAALPAGLGGAAAEALFGGGSAESSQPPLALCAAARPGCVLLTLDALVDATAAADVAAARAEAAAAALLRAPGGVGAFFQVQAAFSVHCGGGGDAYVAHGALQRGAAAPSPAQQKRVPRLRPAAALSTAPTLLTALVCCEDEHAASPPLAARLHGHPLPLPGVPPADGPALALLPACGTEGVALLEPAPSQRAPPQHAPPPRPLLLCRDAALVAEVDATLSAADDSADDESAAENVITVLGHALRPEASLAALAAAAAAAVTLGWTATLARLLPALQHAASAWPGTGDAAAAAACCRGGASLLHRAAACGRADVAAQLLDAAGDTGLFGAAAAPGPDGRTTPLHHAAAACDVSLAALLTAVPAHAARAPAAAAAAGDALCAWFGAVGHADSNGEHHHAATPAQLLAARVAATGCDCAGGKWAALDAALRARLGAAQARCRALLEALEAEGHLRPELQAQEGLARLAAADVASPVNADAAALLRAAARRMQQLATSASPSDADADDGAGGSGSGSGAAPERAPASSAADDDEAAFVAWRAAQSRGLWRAVSGLLLLKALGNCAHAHRSVLAAPAPWAGPTGAAARAYLADTPLHDPHTGAVRYATDIPWPAIVVGTTRLLRATLAVRLPTALFACWLAYTSAGWAWAQRRCDAVFCGVLLAEAAFFCYTDWLIWDVTEGLVVEWPAKLMALRALGLCAALAVGPFSTRWNRVGWVARAAFSGATLLARPRLAARVWRNVGYRVTAALMLAELLLERANQRRLRRAFDAQRRAAAATATAQRRHAKCE